MSRLIIVSVLILSFSGCGVGSILALPVRVTADVVDIVVPETISETIHNVGDTIEGVIPF